MGEKKAMPLVDLETKKIYGCTPGSVSYYHEEGHIVFNDTDKGASMSYRGDAYIKGAVILMAMNMIQPNLIFRILTYALVSLSMYFYFYEEIWCWKYGIKKFNEPKTIKLCLREEDGTKPNFEGWC